MIERAATTLLSLLLSDLKVEVDNRGGGDETATKSKEDNRMARTPATTAPARGLSNIPQAELDAILPRSPTVGICGITSAMARSYVS